MNFVTFSITSISISIIKHALVSVHWTQLEMPSMSISQEETCCLLACHSYEILISVTPRQSLCGSPLQGILPDNRPINKSCRPSKVEEDEKRNQKMSRRGGNRGYQQKDQITLQSPQTCIPVEGRDIGQLLVTIRRESNSTLTRIPDECLLSPTLRPAFVRRAHVPCEQQLGHPRTPLILLLLPTLPSTKSIIQEDVLPLPQCMNPMRSAPQVTPKQTRISNESKLHQLGRKKQGVCPLNTLSYAETFVSYATSQSCTNRPP